MKTALLLIFVMFTFSVWGKENPSGKQSTNSNQSVAANCNPSFSQADLYINNVRTTILAGGDMWWDTANSKYEVPVNSGKHSLFAGSLWIGGIDAGGQIKTAAQTYRQTGNDFWPGAIDTGIVDIVATQCQFYDRHWKLNRQEVLDFVSNGTTTPDIISWPGNGSSANNESNYLAPFVDVNADGLYDYLDGDYPGYNLNPVYPTYPGTPQEMCNDYLFGDQTIWWVINDVGNVHTETQSLPIGIEIRCQAFAFQSTLPSLNNATFYKYQVINRSSETYTQMYFGQWVDPDLGNAVDDYVGCDASRGLGYCYNGDSNDDGAVGYGIDPPAIGVDFLQGPYADIDDATDNDNDGCVDCTFIDSSGVQLVIDDNILSEGIAMSKFVYYNNVNTSPVGNPNGFTDFYNYLRGIWLDNQPITYGADGRNPGNPLCNYMFPGTTDPANPTNWTEFTAGNIPEDRRFIQSAGQFTMLPGEVNYVTTGVVWARQTGGGPLASVALLQQYDDEVQQLFSQCFRVTGVGMDETSTIENIEVYPNPASDFVLFQTVDIATDYVITIYNTSGSKVMQNTVPANNNYQWETKNLPKGTYFYNLNSDNNKIKSGKVVLY